MAGDDLLPFGGDAEGEPAPVVDRGALDGLIAAYADARNVREEADERAKRLREIEDRAEAELFDALERLSIRSVRHARGLFSLSDLAWASVLDEDSARQWAEAERPELLTLNRQRLSVIVREALKEAQPLPPGIDYKVTRKITWRRQ